MFLTTAPAGPRRVGGDAQEDGEDRQLASAEMTILDVESRYVGRIIGKHQTLSGL